MGTYIDIQRPIGGDTDGQGKQTGKDTDRKRQKICKDTYRQTQGQTETQNGRDTYRRGIGTHSDTDRPEILKDMDKDT